MGAYLTWQPRSHTTDAERNCISNIRPEGIGYADAAFKLAHLLRAMRTRRLSGVQLKDDSDRLLLGGARPTSLVHSLGNYDFRALAAIDFATSWAHLMKHSTIGLTVRSLNVTITKGHGRAGNVIGSAFSGSRRA